MPITSDVQAFNSGFTSLSEQKLGSFRKQAERTTTAVRMYKVTSEGVSGMHM